MSEDTRVHYGAKNTVFLDLFSIPEYRLQMFQALHPEMTDVTEDDIKPVTLSPVMTNSQYNDLAFIVRDKLIIFVEAQSTWTINILVRMLLYLAGTYNNYIQDNALNVYTSTKVVIPEPEFYVVYTGSRKIREDTISLRADFWNNPDAKLDLQAKILHAESSDDIIGQYIIFTHVLDGQINIHGRKKIAIEETIRICQTRKVLKEYLETQKKEVTSMFDVLFDQKYIMRAYAIENKRVGEIKGIIDMCKEFGKSLDFAIQKIVANVGLSERQAAEYANKYWNADPNTDPFEEEEEGWAP